MGGNVFANGLEISGKATQAKTIAVFPDTCFTPPQTPATPMGVPVPYPSFGMAEDTENGTATVKISGKEVNIKNKSDLSKTSGTEAGCAPKKNIITSKNTGKKYFASWSPDVKFEGEPVIRFSDLATHDHGSGPGTPPGPEINSASPAPADCAKILAEVGLSVHNHEDKNKNCNNKSNPKHDSSKPAQQSDHVPQATCFTTGSRNAPGLKFPKGTYDVSKAPCVCLEDGKALATEHGRKSEFQAWQTTVWRKRKANNPSWQPTYKDAKRADLNAIRYAKSPHLNPGADGKPHPALKCLEERMDKYFKGELGMTDDTPVSTPNQKLRNEKYMARVQRFRARLV